MREIVFAALLVAHLLADFVFQSDEDVERKERPSVFVKHVLVVTLLSGLFVADLARWDVILLAGLFHALVDMIKLMLSAARSRLAFVLDQIAHVAILFGLATLAVESGVVRPLWTDLFGDAYGQLAILAAGAIAATWTGGVVVGFVVEPLRGRTRGRSGVDGAGRTIGWLERALIFVLVLVGEIGAVGFLVAAKSIFRFGDLSRDGERATAEYILIGTLASFLWGLLIAKLTVTWLL